MNLTARFPRVSESTRKLNPGMFGVERVESTAAKPRLRQERGEKLNKTEAAFANFLPTIAHDCAVYAQSITLKLANGVRYTPDFATIDRAGRLSLYEVKGYMRDDAAVKIKVAATQFARADFYLATATDKSRLAWRIERVMP